MGWDAHPEQFVALRADGVERGGFGLGSVHGERVVGGDVCFADHSRAVVAAIFSFSMLSLRTVTGVACAMLDCRRRDVRS